MSIQQREYKFRAWDRKKNKMSGKFDLGDASYEGFPPPFVDENGEHDLDADMVVMQFTGLLDKNGKEIYEGDILRLIESPPTWNDTEADYVVLNYIGVIEWDNEGADYNITGKEELRGLGNGKQETEIIGNVWENPDLLTEKK